MMTLTTIAFATMIFILMCLRQHWDGEGKWGDLLIPVIITRNP